MSKLSSSERLTIYDKLAALVGFLLLVIFAPLIWAVIGAYVGWIVGFLFSETILSFLAGIGITGLKMWQVGASLGFIGGFFKAHTIRMK
jgi:hypothetical protein